MFVLSVPVSESTNSSVILGRYSNRSVSGREETVVGFARVLFMFYLRIDTLKEW